MTSRRSVLKAAIGVTALAGLTACAATGKDTVTRSDRTPPLGDLIQVDGKTVHVAEAGRGPAVVLLHGASGNLRDLTFDLTGHLNEAGFRTLAFDRPGLGYSDRLHDRGESPQEQARHLAKALDARGVDRAIIVGHSFGGSVAMAWALERPDQAAGVVTLGGATMPWPGGLGPWYSIASSDLGGATLVPLLVALVPRSRAPDFAQSLFNPDPLPTGYIDYVGVDLTLRPAQVRTNARQVNGLKPHIQVMSQKYPGLTLPVEILHGTADKVVPETVHAIPMSRILPNGNLVLLEGRGHMPHHAEQEAVVAAVARAARASGLR